MAARVNKLPWQQDESFYLSHFNLISTGGGGGGHDSQKRNQMLHLKYNCIVFVHLSVDWLQTRYTKRNHKGIF